MPRVPLLLAVAAAAAAGAHNVLAPDERRQGVELLFNGRDLDGWEGDPALWSVEDGKIVGSTDGAPLASNSFLIFGKEYADFEIEFEVKLRNGNSGVQFRSERLPDGAVRGYQADIAEGKGWGSLHGERLPGGLIMDGWQGKAEHGVRPGWNHVAIYCRGHHIRIAVNGRVMTDVRDPGALRGVFALQLHRGPPMRVEYRNLKLRRLSQDEHRSVNSDRGAPPP